MQSRRHHRPAAAVQLREHARLVPPSVGQELVSAAVTVEQQLVLLWAPSADRAALRGSTTSPAGARFPDVRPERPAAATVVVLGPEPRTVPLVQLDVAHPHVELLPGGRVLVVGSRASWSAEQGAEHNAVVYDADGQVVQTATLGDGVAHVQTTVGGDVWVGYFDEGIYGNDGWDGPAPLGAAGLVRFGADLRPAWALPHDDHIPSVDDCYALNVGRSAVWTCYYADFPVLRIDGAQVTVLANDVTASGVLLADEEQVAFIGGRDRQPSSLTRCRIEAGRVEPEPPVPILLPDGSALDQAHVFARDDQLHVVDGDRWSRAEPLQRRA